MKNALFVCAALAALGMAGTAFGAATVIGEGPATECYEAARQDRADIAALRICNYALDGDITLTRSDSAATSVNRGIIYLNRQDPTRALADFDQAIRLRPEIGEAYVNRGAALLFLDRDAEALASLSRAIELETVELHKAYFNRGLANEELGETRAAFDDYNRAAELAPTWEEPRRELARFTVSRR